MVRRKAVSPPPVVGQDARAAPVRASMKATRICVLVISGFSEAAAFRTTSRAPAWSFRSAIARTPSRAAADNVPCTWKAWPNSAMPRTSMTSSGTMRANSTALAPRCSRRRLLIRAHHLSLCRGAAAPRTGPRRPAPSPRAASPNSRDGLRGQGSASSGGSGTATELVGDALEEPLELLTEQHDRGDDHDGDQADHEAVLDGGRALLVPLEAVLGEGHQADEGGVGLQHVYS